MSSLLRRLSLNVVKNYSNCQHLTGHSLKTIPNSHPFCGHFNRRTNLDINRIAIRYMSIDSHESERLVMDSKDRHNYDNINDMNDTFDTNIDINIKQTTMDTSDGIHFDNKLNLEVDPSGSGQQTLETTIKDFWLKHDITVHGREAPLPMLDMDSYSWPEAVQQALNADGFAEPTPIQCQGWPIVLSGRDMVGVAQTGSGKTLCYVLPAFVKILKEGIKRGPKCLVLSPTRELAQQIQSVIRRYNFASNVCLYGGASRLPQMQILRNNNPQIIIATPGRMNDFVESSVVDLRTVDYLVLDEADRMLDMGFEPQIRRIIEHIPRERQTVMWSATWPKEVKDLAAQYMKDYIQINVGGRELMANKNIEQIVEICEEYDKNRRLMEVLKNISTSSSDNKTLIFAKTKQSVDYLTKTLRFAGLSAVAIHGDKSQAVRDQVLGDFRKNHFSILVATDVAARGLDVDDIKYVINFDYPNTGEDYVHRIGRTGRRDKTGTAFTFLTSEEARQADELIAILRESNQTVSPQLLEMSNMAKNVAMDKKRRKQFRTPGAVNAYGYQYDKGYRKPFVQRERQYNNTFDGNQQHQPRRRPEFSVNYGSTQSYGVTPQDYNNGYRQQTNDYGFDRQSYGSQRQPSDYRPNYRSNYESNYGQQSNYDNSYGSSRTSGTERNRDY
ncbi:uncharacterized protein LOC128960448 [Oppia nitens]|uniref:uncharacterized protein LOC128960448 n=1 Tax=Oppia nitens TaxID=1686743 RepID=UPI0023DA2A01|nr:uncharacterized protein LOC128960448 [Oppia nitens]